MDQTTFNVVRKQLEEQGFKVISEDLARPWGGFYVLDEGQLAQFVATYFPGLDLPEDGLPKSPKILMVAPHQRLSWQYHGRRAEIWSVMQGPVAVAMSDTDEQPESQKLEQGQQITMEQGTRHRLIGLGDWGVVAEIWAHTDAAAPSDEDDIVRVEDDYSR